jgi:hypothetical protein
MHATRDDLSIPSGNTGFRSAGCVDLTMGELLADPLTGALMRADRLEVGDVEKMLRTVAGRIQLRGPARPIVAPRADGEPRPRLPVYLSGRRLPRHSESTTMRSTPAAVAAKTSAVSCGSHCPW